MFRAGEPEGSRFPQRYSGVITAGHCLYNTDEPWNQGGSFLGRTRMIVFDDGKKADAGTIGMVRSDRDVSNKVYVNSQFSQGITSIVDENHDQKGDRVCFSGGTSGTNCGNLLRTNGTAYYRERRIRSLRVMDIPCSPGDSGAPVWHGNRAMGIVVALITERGDRRCAYSQIGHVQQLALVDITKHD